MTQAAAFRATYSDFKLIKTRGVVSISFEVPLEQVDLAYQVLGGMPDVSAERWFGIAAIKLGGEPAHSPRPPVEAAGPSTPPEDRPHRPRKPVAAEKRLANEAGRMCADQAFRAFLISETPGVAVLGFGEPEAALLVRTICAVCSRAEIVPGSEAAERWIDLRGRFEAWKLA